MHLELFEMHLYNQSSHYENTDDFCYEGKPEGKPSCATTKLTPFTVSINEWDKNEDIGKFMNNALCVLQYAKRHVSC